MKFRTEIEKFELKSKIDYGTKIFAVGSCFAQNIAARLTAAKFQVTQCPVGILFNPASITKALTAFAQCNTAYDELIVERGGGFVSLECHSDLMQPTRQRAIDCYNNAIAAGHKALSEAQCIIITLGTAWIYEYNATGDVVANCHKLPQNLFTRRRMSVEEIVGEFKPLLEGILSDKRVIFTVSPVRHIADGLAENSLSKSTLRVAIAELCERFDNVDYFPAYEIVTDDLRDYRFYADDLVHPSNQAIEYIWERFVSGALTADAQQLLPKVEKIVAAAAHRPFNPQSEEYKKFCTRYLADAKALSLIDFSSECALFEQYSEKN